MNNDNDQQRKHRSIKSSQDVDIYRPRQIVSSTYPEETQYHQLIHRTLNEIKTLTPAKQAAVGGVSGIATGFLFAKASKAAAFAIAVQRRVHDSRTITQTTTTTNQDEDIEEINNIQGGTSSVLQQLRAFAYENVSLASSFIGGFLLVDLVMTKKLSHFDEWKSVVLLSGKDLSRKHSIDEYIVDLMNMINQHSDYYTSSSCSGRTIVFATTPTASKSDCQWLYVTHGEANVDEIWTCIEASASKSHLITFKYEPFIVHIICRNIECAKQLLNLVLECGYRNSGLVLSKQGKITLGVRSTHGLEVPIVINGELCVDKSYIVKLVTIANEKMCTNFQRIDRFKESIEKKICHNDLVS
ncbi:unnamed protein product [Didymodactylos carnosus]|uniref:tRNA wybutosine-synthesizing protein 3 homolog n=1 Tax=Didymodactylos carnosus TaxID=1234261 RepID=A0A814KEK3_9BILA|nr:unnamed protein product [Didymodactylos carnosus]CAF1050520.1 unnamed protein product [Didymodactylos carnosus]CAF3550630.1 unnamed protein product [Didymodactylos carnosus]CAF3820231.1 unnamed protein product [Didymodactylos carnosus]